MMLRIQAACLRVVCRPALVSSLVVSLSFREAAWSTCSARRSETVAHKRQSPAWACS